MIDFKEKLDLIIDKYMDAILKILDEENVKEVKTMISKLKILIQLKCSLDNNDKKIEPLALMMLQLINAKKNK